jgi:16S rRNA (guanine527-N7)-methyltransferase
VSLARIREAFADASIAELPEKAYEQLHLYLDLLTRWNTRLSLTSVREPEEMIQRHLVECAFAAQHLPANIETLLDYGSGAGLPGIVIAICRPEIRVTLAEAHGKKAAFLREAVRTTGVAADVYDGRVESLPPSRLFHAVSLRAVEKMEAAIPEAVRHMEDYLVLFTTEESAPDFGRLVEGLEWIDPISLPNSTQRILSIGKRLAPLPGGLAL